MAIWTRSLASWLEPGPNSTASSLSQVTPKMRSLCRACCGVENSYHLLRVRGGPSALKRTHARTQPYAHAHTQPISTHLHSSAPILHTQTRSRHSHAYIYRHTPCSLTQRHIFLYTQVHSHTNTRVHSHAPDCGHLPSLLFQADTSLCMMRSGPGLRSQETEAPRVVDPALPPRPPPAS